METEQQPKLRMEQKIGIVCAVLTMICAILMWCFGNVPLGITFMCIGVINLCVNTRKRERKNP